MSPSVLEPKSQIFNSPAENVVDLNLDFKSVTIPSMFSDEDFPDPLSSIRRAIAHAVVMDLSMYFNRTVRTALNQSDYISTTLNQTDNAPTILNQVYVIDGHAEVNSFVRRYRLRQMLEEAVEPLKAAFGQTAIRVLKLVTDEEGSQTLYCLVMVPDSLENARHSLDSFDRQWWLERCGPVAGKLNFDYELI